MDELFALLPVEYRLLAFKWIVIATAVVPVGRKVVVPILRWGADFTAATWDNALVQKLSDGLDALAIWLDTTMRSIPRMGFEPSPVKEPVTSKTSRRPPPPPIGAPPPPAGAVAVAAIVALDDTPAAPAPGGTDDPLEDTQRRRFPPSVRKP